MDGTITLRSSERKALLDEYRRSPDPGVRLRAHSVLLLAAGYPWQTSAAMLFCSTPTIGRWKRRFERGRVAAVRENRRGRHATCGAWLSGLVVSWVTGFTPRDFGFLRSRRCCGVVVLRLVETTQVQVGPETVRRGLHRENLVWRRPRPGVGPTDPQRAVKLRKLREWLAHLPPDEIAVFQDEVDIDTNPKSGARWMPRGKQALVPTPGTNEKRSLAGSSNWRTGGLIVTAGLAGEGRNAAWFVRPLDDLRYPLRRYRKIHAICDHAKFHDCRRGWAYLRRWGQRVQLHFLPAYAPDTNPLERSGWPLPEEIARHHRCASLDELLDLVFTWLECRRPFAVEDQTYPLKPAA